MTGQKRMGQEVSEQQDAVAVQAKKQCIEKPKDEQEKQKEKLVLRRSCSGSIDLKQLPIRIWDAENKPPSNEAITENNPPPIITSSTHTQTGETTTDSSRLEIMPKLELDFIAASINLIVKFKEIILAANNDAKFATWIQMNAQKAHFALVKVWDQMLRGVLTSPESLKNFIHAVNEVNTNVNAMLEFFEKNPIAIPVVLALGESKLQELTDAWAAYKNKMGNKIAAQKLSAQDPSLNSTASVGNIEGTEQSRPTLSNPEASSTIYQNPIFGKAVSRILRRKSKRKSKQNNSAQEPEKTIKPVCPQISL